jgi:hypothetical protein
MNVGKQLYNLLVRALPVKPGFNSPRNHFDNIKGGEVLHINGKS